MDQAEGEKRRAARQQWAAEKAVEAARKAAETDERALQKLRGRRLPMRERLAQNCGVRRKRARTFAMLRLLYENLNPECLNIL